MLNDPDDVILIDDSDDDANTFEFARLALNGLISLEGMNAMTWKRQGTARRKVDGLVNLFVIRCIEVKHRNFATAQATWEKIVQYASTHFRERRRRRNRH